MPGSGRRELSDFEKDFLIPLVLLFILGFSIYSTASGINWELDRKYKLASTETGVIKDATCVPRHQDNPQAFILHYSYQVNGVLYSSSQANFYQNKSCNLGLKYYAGLKVIVYYDRSDPSFAVLEPGLDHTPLENMISNMGFQLLVTAVTAFVLLYLIWKLVKKGINYVWRKRSPSGLGGSA